MSLKRKQISTETNITTIPLAGSSSSRIPPSATNTIENDTVTNNNQVNNVQEIVRLFDPYIPIRPLVDIITKYAIPSVFMDIVPSITTEDNEFSFYREAWAVNQWKQRLFKLKSFNSDIEWYYNHTHMSLGGYLCILCKNDSAQSIVLVDERNAEKYGYCRMRNSDDLKTYNICCECIVRHRMIPALYPDLTYFIRITFHPKLIGDGVHHEDREPLYIKVRQWMDFTSETLDVKWQEVKCIEMVTMKISDKDEKKDARSIYNEKYSDMNPVDRVENPGLMNVYHAMMVLGGEIYYDSNPSIERAIHETTENPMFSYS